MDTTIYKLDPPAHIVERITKLGGTNVFNRPNFRVIWGGCRYHTVGGMFKKVVVVKDDTIIGKEVSIVTQVAEIRQLHKYRWDRWWLERWLPPEAYGSREEWYQNSWDEESKLHTMGDFPSEGDYEAVFYLAQCSHMKPEDTEWCRLCQATSGEYIPLEENVHILEQQIRALLLSGNVSKTAEMLALFERENVKRQLRNKEVAARVQGAMRSRLALQPTSWQTGDRCSVPEANFRIMAPSRPGGFRQSETLINTKEEN